MLATLTIRDVRRATPRARTVLLDLAGEDFPYRAGQAVLIATHSYTPRRPYSLASSPADSARTGALELLIGVDENGNAGPHLIIEPGVAVDVEGPVGSFMFPEAPVERRFLFLAGGVGIAPLRAMLHDALAIDGATVGVLYSARTPDEFAYADELRRLAGADRIDLKMTVTRAVDGAWTGGRGRITAADLAPLVHDAATLCFVCGPQSMVDEMPSLLQSLGVAPERIRLEEW